MELGELGDIALWARVGMALLCGGMVGLERQIRGKPAGMRTSSLICLGTTIFVYLSLGLRGEFGGDSTRVMAQVVSGVGFLGAGVIISRNGLVTGVTSAAVVWVLAAVGGAIGAGRFGVALATSVSTVGILVGVEKLEHVFAALRRGVHADPTSLPAPQEDESFEATILRHRSSGVPPPKQP
ncbi:MAG TPA: MgtC/SapB family protein [Polyangiales bacterium]